MSTATIARPAADEYRDYYGTYIDRVPDGDLLELLDAQTDELHEVLDGVTDQQANTLHEPYTWTIKQVVGHLIDCERIFGSRLHRFASGDLTPLPGMDQNPYIDNNDYQSPTLTSLVKELECCRYANLLLLQRIRPEAWDLSGQADGHAITVRALAWILAGHIIHHLEIVRQRLQ